MSIRRCLHDAKFCEAREDALRAILARINGVWDDPALQAHGPLRADTLSDVAEMARVVDTEESDDEDDYEGV